MSRLRSILTALLGIGLVLLGGLSVAVYYWRQGVEVPPTLAMPARPALSPEGFQFGVATLGTLLAMATTSTECVLQFVAPSQYTEGTLFTAPGAVRLDALATEVVLSVVATSGGQSAWTVPVATDGSPLMVTEVPDTERVQYRCSAWSPDWSVFAIPPGWSG